ncbi:MAG TPA: spore germination protein [Firmicutes bacterium]|nr:spore germination protein [Bacillota bacterium]
MLIVHGLNLAFVLGAKKWEHRAISDPATENLVRGPREGFNELMKVNVALVRRRVKDPQFRVKYLKLGKRSVTDCALLYLEDVANPVLVDEVKRRIDLINIDGILDSGYIEQFIQDTPYSPFPQVQYTERPDRVAAAILEGRVAIVSDGSPNALIAPATLTNFLPAPEDYYERWLLMTAIRIVRTASLLNSILLPSLYIAFLNFHQEIIPSRLVLAIAGARAGVPFSAVVEAFIMEFTFELLREAGIRLPAPIASTIGIVGGIIIGQAAVSAGLVSPVMVIVVALTAIGSFAIPSFNVALSIRILRFPLMLLSAMFGLYGLTAGGILIVMHLVTLKSFGVPYLSPIAPLTLSGLTDTMVRAPAWQHRLRPLMFRPRNKYRSAPSTSYFQGKRAMHEHGFEVAPLADGAAKEGSET